MSNFIIAHMLVPQFEKELWHFYLYARRRILTYGQTSGLTDGKSHIRFRIRVSLHVKNQGILFSRIRRNMQKLTAK